MAKASPFGKDSRVRILRRHYDESGPFSEDTAWKFVYQELLWIDGSTGLAHLYESVKAQPGRSLWYQRTVTFTNLLCHQFGLQNRQELKLKIDRLFRACLEKLAQSKQAAAGQEEILAAVAEVGEGSGLPADVVREAAQAAEAEGYVPDEDLVAEFAALLVEKAGVEQSEAGALAREMVARARFYFTVERKRQNVLGEGFEDLLHLLAVEVLRVPAEKLVIRKRANKLPGFASESSRERIEAPDLAVVVGEKTDLLASIKWSLRQDRQKQLSDELDCFVDLLSQNKFPRYVLITNECDPGRLINTAGLARRGQSIDCIHHINPDLLLAALSDHPKVKEVQELIDSKKLRSLADFLREMKNQYGAGTP